MNGDIEEWIVDWFSRNTTLGKEEIRANLDRNYLESGWIDSFKFINLISDLEEYFMVKFSNDQFQDREFGTVEGLIKVVREKVK
jgi:acyl carrier protein